MIKSKKLFLCLLLLFGLGGITAEAAGTAKITASSCTVERGAAASVSFNLSGNPGIWGLKLRIQYDHSALTLKSVTTGSVFQEDEITLSETLDKDPFVVVASGNKLENKTADGTVITLDFSVNSDAEYKSYPVTVEVTQANDVAGNKVSVDSENGSVVVAKQTSEETAGGKTGTGTDRTDNPETDRTDNSETDRTDSTENDKTGGNETDKPSGSSSVEKETKSSAMPIVITLVIVLVILLAGGAAVFFVIKKRRS